ncbi:MAG: flagellar protein FlgN [Phycisphaerales bacterium]|nr:flagellar protein FlgN [Phycisphaerales bacterium]
MTAANKLSRDAVAEGHASTPLTHASALESLLNDLLVAHESLVQVCVDQREAVRTADPASVRLCSDRHAELLDRIAALDSTRCELVNAMTRSLPRSALPAGPVTLTHLAGMTPEPHRTRLVELAGRVRSAIERAADQQRTLKSATASLVAHMEGLVRQVAQRLSHAGTYGRRGVIESAPVVVSGLDLVT